MAPQFKPIESRPKLVSARRNCC